MGYEYIHINSADRKDYERDSHMTIHLSNPIQRAHSVKVMSFSCANEFYNVGHGFEVNIVVYKFDEMGVIEEDNPIEINFGLEADLYTIAEMCLLLNDVLTTAVQAVLPNCTMQFVILSNSKVSLQIVQIKDELTDIVEPLRVVVVFPTVLNFYASIIHRLRNSQEPRSQTSQRIPSPSFERTMKV